ncbi:MAG: ankyrin repeat domain-containing protein [Planctomycetes bacterium]|nr:ankyrin repeat domain-containing protein [Planctomycetota bacterium]
MLIDDLLVAILAEDVTRVRTLLQCDPDVSNQTNADYSPDKPLHLAIAKSGSSLDASVIVSELISAGADVNSPGENGATPLHIAVAHDLVFEAMKLVGAGARLDSRDAQGQTPFESIAHSKKYACLGYLLSQGVANEIHEAVAFNRIDWVKWILRDNPNVIRESHRSIDLVYRAITNRNPTMLQLLVLQGARVNPMPQSTSPLRMAVGSGSLAMIQMLLDAGADPNGRPSSDPPTGLVLSRLGFATCGSNRS